MAAAVERFGGIDVLFNGAGILAFGTAVSTDEATWRRVIDVNLTGTFLVSRAVVPEMIRRGGGAIVNASSSTGAHDGNANAVAYVASKGGVTLLTRCMAIDHAVDSIRVNAVAPGPTDTPMLRANMYARGARGVRGDVSASAARPARGDRKSGPLPRVRRGVLRHRRDPRGRRRSDGAGVMPEQPPTGQTVTVSETVTV